MSETVALTQGLPSHIGPGMVIAGKYRLEAEIGRGSMGTVFRAVHVTLGQRVAIKLISSEHSPSSEARQRFSVEAKAAAKLRSRHVVQVYDDGETPEGNPYIVLEYLDGETLEQRLEREHDIPLSDAVRIGNHVGRALARAHAQGIVHRDLKPANIFLVKTEDDELGWIAKVLDFGIAKLANASTSQKGTTQAGTVLGTPLFMSPEQVRGASSVDHRADLYSLGMCLYHMLTGELAFYSPNYSDILVSICTQPLPLLRDKAPWVSEAVEQWFQRACAKEPFERFQSADEMTEALAAAAGTSPLSKHKSVPEGRIAPETLVGYASPTITTTQPDTGPLSMARTQVVLQPGAVTAPGLGATGASPGHASPEQAGGRVPAPVAIAIGGDPSTTGSEWLPRRRDLRPLVVGLCLGFLALATIAITLVSLSSSDDDKLPVAPHAAAAPSAAPPPHIPSEAPRTQPTAPEPTPTTASKSAGSSVTAESSDARPSPKTRPKRPQGGARAPGQPPRASASSVPSRSGAAKAPGSDLGF